MSRSGLRVRGSFALAAAVALALVGVVPTTAEAATAPLATVVQSIALSGWSPASPDPSGVAYRSATDHLVVVDSEVDETSGAGYHGVNVWETTRTGVVVATGTTVGAFSSEPTGAGMDPATETLFVSDDDAGRVFARRAGPDGTFGTADDVNSGSVNTKALAIPDTEDPAFDTASGALYFLSGTSTDVYRVDPVNGVFGDGDDTISSFDVGFLGFTDAEGLAYDAGRNTLLVGASNDFIYELTPTGTLVRSIDARVAGLAHVSGLAVAPSSNGSASPSYWVVDRGVDNDANPAENDGRLFELQAPPDGTNLAPVLESVTIDQSAPTTDAVLTVTPHATDLDGPQPLQFSYQWSKNGTDLPGATAATLALSAPGNGDKGDLVAVRVSASDGLASTTWVSATPVTVSNAAPVFGPAVSDRNGYEGQPVDIEAGATDPDGDGLTYVADGLPPGLVMDPVSGRITGTISAGAATASPYTVTVRAADGPPSVPSPDVSLVQSASGTATSGSTITVTLPSTPAPGDLLVATARFSYQSTGVPPTDWRVAVQASSPKGFVMYKVVGAGESRSVTLTLNPYVSSVLAMTVVEYSGLVTDMDTVLDRTGTGAVASGSTSTSVALSAATTAAAELVVATVNVSGTANPTFSGTWTNGFAQATTGPYQAVAQRAVTTTGTFSTGTSWTATSVTGGTATIASFRRIPPVVTDSRSTTRTFTWTVGTDTTDPDVVVTTDPSSPDGDAGWYRSAVTVTVTAGDAGGVASTEYSVDGGQSWVAFTAPFTVPDGTYDVQARATDLVGNTGVAQTTIQQDTVGPTVALVGGPDGTPELGAVPSAPTCDAADSTSGLRDCVVSGYSDALGSHTLTAAATDVAGNTSSDIRKYTVVDTVEPAVTMTLSPPAADGADGWYRTAVTVTVGASDLGGVATTEISVDGGETWQAYTEPLAVADGVHDLRARATDPSGNTGADQATVRQDTVLPLVALVGGPSGTQELGSVAPPPTCDASDATSGLKDCVVTGYGTDLGPHTLVATATDVAGNTSSDSRSYTVVDADSAPTATDDAYSTQADVPLQVTPPGVLGNDTDADGDSLGAVLEGAPAHASSFALAADGSFTYVPASGYVGTDSFQYRATAGGKQSAVATVTLTVAAPTWAVQHFPNEKLSGAPSVATAEPVSSGDQLVHDWGTGGPTGVGADRFSSRYTTTFWVGQAGDFIFRASADDGFRVLVDGVWVLRDWGDRGQLVTQTLVQLGAGSHTVVVEYYEHTGAAALRVGWYRVGGQHWTAEYYANETLKGVPAVVIDDAFGTAHQLDHSWGTSGPATLPVDGFSARFSSTVVLGEGDYQFTLRSDDGARLRIDGSLVLNDWKSHADRTRTVTVHLASGEHTIVVEYFEHTGTAVVQLSW